MDKRNIYFISIFVVIVLVIGGITVGLHIGRGSENEVDDGPIDGGVVKNGRLKGYSEKIKSTEIVYFEYKSYYFSALCEKKDDRLNIKVSGYIDSNINKSYDVEYNSSDLKFLNKLQDVVKKYEISKNNGYEYEIAGLSPEYGDTISVEYKSGEKIWKTDNQSNTLSDEAIDELYKLFSEISLKNGYNFEKIAESK